MHQETLTYQTDGLTMRSRLLFEPAHGPRAGVLVFPEAFGLDEVTRRNADRLARAGYLTLAVDLFSTGGGKVRCIVQGCGYSEGGADEASEGGGGDSGGDENAA